jgi:hypothetical protein
VCHHAQLPLVYAAALTLLTVLERAAVNLLQSFIQVFTLAFVVVGATCAIMVPILLYMLQLQQFGWNWIHACMFGAMIASTDAVAIVSIMKTSERCLGRCFGLQPYCKRSGKQASIFFTVLQRIIVLMKTEVIVANTDACCPCAP